MVKRFVGWVALGLLLVGASRHQALTDWWILRTYHPSSQIERLSAAAGLSTTGSRLLHLGRAEVDDKASFNAHCQQGELRQSLTLGCYSAGHIYILEVDRTKLKAVMTVTAAHEMLHAAYERLNGGQRAEVNQLVEMAYQKITDAKFRALIKSYAAAEPGQVDNELHSLLATEVSQLDPALEAYYQRYFASRTLVVKAFDRYEGVFRDLETKRDQLLAELTNLKSQIDSLNAQAQAAAAKASDLAKQIQRLRSEGKTQESNALVPAQNAAAREANSLSAQASSLVATYNDLVKSVNQLALVQDDLVSSLDSTKATAH